MDNLGESLLLLTQELEVGFDSVGGKDFFDFENDVLEELNLLYVLVFVGSDSVVEIVVESLVLLQ